MKKLSIITVCYNEPNLEDTCKSIVNQTWQDFEWIVVDGASNEETQKIWDKYKYRIDKFISEQDTGVYNAMNKGIKLATGEYLNFMNAGDSFFYKDSLLDIFELKNYTADILYGHDYLYKKDYVVRNLPIIFNKEFLYISSLAHQAAFIKKELFEKYGLYNEKYKIVSDYEKWFCFYVNGAKYEYLPHIIVKYDTRGISSNDKYKQLHKQERQQVIRQYFTQEEIDEIERVLHPNILNVVTYANPLEYIFSVKNTKDKKYKVLTICGIKFKFKR